jgi:hypothetical protein
MATAAQSCKRGNEILQQVPGSFNFFVGKRGEILDRDNFIGTVTTREIFTYPPFIFTACGLRLRPADIVVTFCPAPRSRSALAIPVFPENFIEQGEILTTVHQRRPGRSVNVPGCGHVDLGQTATKIDGACGIGCYSCKAKRTNKSQQVE